MSNYVAYSGSSELACWHDPDEIRRWIQDNKTREPIDKTMEISEAIDRYVADGSYIVIGGFGCVRVPMAAIYEIIRQKKKNMTMGAKTAVLDADLLIASGVVSSLEATYSFGHEMRGLSRAARRAVESGRAKVISEWSNAAFQWRLKAAGMGIPFFPMRGMLGSDTLRKSSAKVIMDPFSQKPITLVPACYPDIAIIHVHRADKYGNSQIDGITVEDLDLAKAAKRLIITTEKIVDSEEIRQRPDRTAIPYFLVDAVVEVPYGAHPTNMPYVYYSDEEIYGEWLLMSKTDDGVREFLNKYVYSIKDFKEYLELVGGMDKMKLLIDVENLKDKPKLKWLEG